MSPVQKNGKCGDHVNLDGLEQLNENQPEFVSVPGLRSSHEIFRVNGHGQSRILFNFPTDNYKPII